MQDGWSSRAEAARREAEARGCVVPRATDTEPQVVERIT